jgi:hypothetical protein
VYDDGLGDFLLQFTNKMEARQLTLLSAGAFFTLLPHSVHQRLVPGNLPHSAHLAIGVALIVMATRV